MPVSRVPVGILGATGMVGQMFIRLLENNPFFEVTELAASEKSAGKTYGEAMEGRWNVSAELPEYVRELQVKNCEPSLDCRLVFSALDASVAGGIEEEFARAGYAVSSNAKNHRMDRDVPLLVPEINSQHLGLIEIQRKNRNWEGFMVTHPNCSTTHLSLALKPLYDDFGLEDIIVTTMQALSGAGYPGVASLDILDNVIPFIGGEEEKLQTEILKIFGEMDGNGIQNSSFRVSAQCNRVNVRNGHTECVSVKLSHSASLEDVASSLESFKPLKELKLPSSPERPIVLLRNEDRPQPKYDREIERGMASVVGRLRPCNVFDYKFVVLGHNLVRGAAGAAILNAELMKAKGWI
jgi:aspartate-semialdehyde dehydrogenase